MATDKDLQKIGLTLDSLVRLRNQADYQTRNVGAFAKATVVLQAVKDALAMVGLLDQIDLDPIRRAAAIPIIRKTLPP